jgi:uncharacterized delta-60 repeat protein
MGPLTKARRLVLSAASVRLRARLPQRLAERTLLGIPSGVGPMLRSALPGVVTLGLLGAKTLAAQEGVLDPSFGTGGLVLTDFQSGSDDRIFAIVVLQDGRILAAGASNGDFALAKYLPSGTPDLSFGTQGRFTFDFGGTDTAYSIAVQADQRIVLAGVSETTNPNAQTAAVLRCSSAGALDGTFGLGGIASFPGRPTLRAVHVHSDDKIYVAGGDSTFAVGRLLTNGSPDPLYGQDGWNMPLGAWPGGATDLALSPDGSATIAGRGTGALGGPHYAVGRYTAAGSLDPTFAGGNFAATSFGADEAPNAVKIGTVGMVHMGGWAEVAGNDWFVIAMTSSSGQGWSGRQIPFESGLDGRANDLVLHQGELGVLAGFARSSKGDDDFGLMRVTLCAGSGGCDPDPTFGANGRVRTDFGAGVDDVAQAIVIPTPGKLLVGGYSLASGSPDFALAQYAATTPVRLLGFEIR